ncbi:MAG: hypothetical protein AB8W37_11980 [Arsenophonus endosymbiont of Dermacentor nuttalli]
MGKTQSGLAVADDIGLELLVVPLSCSIMSASLIWPDADTLLIETVLVPSRTMKINSLDNNFITLFSTLTIIIIINDR